MAAIELRAKPHCQVEDFVNGQGQSSERHSEHQSTATGAPQLSILYQHLHIEITAPNGILTPADLKEMTMPEGLIWSQGVVVEGRAPVWLYGTLVHACHPAKWIACFDPRLGSGEANTGGAVVVMSHTTEVAVGDVLIVRMPDEWLE